MPSPFHDLAALAEALGLKEFLLEFHWGHFLHGEAKEVDLLIHSRQGGASSVARRFTNGLVFLDGTLHSLVDNIVLQQRCNACLGLLIWLCGRVHVQHRFNHRCVLRPEIPASLVLFRGSLAARKTAPQCRELLVVCKVSKSNSIGRAAAQARSPDLIWQPKANAERSATFLAMNTVPCVCLSCRRDCELLDLNAEGGRAPLSDLLPGLLTGWVATVSERDVHHVRGLVHRIDGLSREARLEPLLFEDLHDFVAQVLYRTRLLGVDLPKWPASCGCSLTQVAAEFQLRRLDGGQLLQVFADNLVDVASRSIMAHVCGRVDKDECGMHKVWIDVDPARTLSCTLLNCSL
mmetsp:Transcript_23499/g.65828  ORF Transcript_23499/g.65828 Transcript_23499/m.65828 type:complete len:348 (+) Transcript_23499:603-1646(+)